MQRYKILWADDEIELLKPHIIFLEAKGIDIVPVLSGKDALDKVKSEFFDAVFLDENMPGMSGLEALTQIKAYRPALPVVMITKSEEEAIMEQAIGSKISDYLIKPINPNQILLSVKKILQNRSIMTEKTNSGYLQEFRTLNMELSDNLSHAEWADTYKKLVHWDMQIQGTEGREMREVLETQWTEANQLFSQFIKKNYESWLNDAGSDKPLLSHQLLATKVLPLIDKKEPIFFILIDNLRYDQWKMLEPFITEDFYVNEESHYYSILPTTTEYARNSLFAGMMPSEIEKRFPAIWEQDEGSRNQHEEELLRNFLERNKRAIKFSYNKIVHQQQGKNLLDQVVGLIKQNPFNAVVYNFVDMLSHARSDMDVLKELAPDESAYRSLTSSWYNFSPLRDMLKMLAAKGIQVVITTDHGTVRVDKAHKVIGDRETNSNLRYKEGRNLSYEESKDVFSVKKPNRFFLPSKTLSSSYVFAMMNTYFVYPNNYNHFVNLYKNSFQHGGVSMEEIIIPFVHLVPKK